MGASRERGLERLSHSSTFCGVIVPIEGRTVSELEKLLN